jgi:predicted metal-dependent peptidase
MCVVEARTALLTQAPFFAVLLYERMEIVISDKYATLATDGRRIYINPGYFDSLTVRQRVFGLAHEVGHGMWRHCARALKYSIGGLEGNKFSPMLWNIAGDLIINDMLIQSQIGEFKDGWLVSADHGYRDLTEDVYLDLLKKLPPPPGGGGGSGGQGEPDGQDNQRVPGVKGERFDDHLDPDDDVLDPGREASEEAKWQQSVANAAQAAKARGDLPAGLEFVIGAILNPKVDWRERIRPVMTRVCGRDESTWTRPNRRRLAVSPMVWMPGRTSHKAGRIVLGLDTSGSVSELELQQFLGEATGIFSDLNPTELWVVCCDANVAKVDLLVDASELDDLRYHLAGRGGTRFEPVFEWVEEHFDGVPDALVYCTDLGGTFPDTAPDYPVLWVATQDGEAPFGETIHIDIRI